MLEPKTVRLALLVATAAAAVVVAASQQPRVGAQEQPLAKRMQDIQATAWGACPDFMPKGCQIAVLHGDPSKPNADVFFRVPGGAVVPPHRHTSAERMVLVSGVFEVTYEGQKPVTLRPGTYAFGPANHVHAARCTGSEACTLFIAFEQPVDAIPAEMTK
jgi:quercetin dioxygenase-like cupin family protein